MVNVPLTPAPSPRVRDEVLILQMDRERREKREDIKKSVSWAPAHQEQICTPLLLDEDFHEAKRQCIRDENRRTISYGSGVAFYALSPRNLNATFQDCETSRLNTDQYIREPPVPISPC